MLSAPPSALMARNFVAFGKSRGVARGSCASSTCWPTKSSDRRHVSCGNDRVIPGILSFEPKIHTLCTKCHRQTRKLSKRPNGYGACSMPKASSIHRARCPPCTRERSYGREEGPVVDLAAGAAAGVLPKLLDDRAEDGLRRKEAGSPQRPLHAGLGDVPGVETVVVHKEGGQTQALLVDLLRRRAVRFSASSNAGRG